MLGAVPVEGFDVDEDGSLDDGFWGRRGAEDAMSVAACESLLVDFGASEDLEGGLVGVVHEEEGYTGVVLDVADG